MNRRWVLFVAIALASILLAACGPAATQEPRYERTFEAPPRQPASKDTAPGGVPEDEAQILAQATAAGQRMVVSTAEMVVIVDDVAVSLPQVEALVGQMEGYILSSSSYRTATDRLAATITMRVPSKRFHETLTALRALAKKVESETLSGQDVTDQYIDLEARLKVLQATEKELVNLLSEVRQSEGNAQEKAQAILDIYSKLTEVRAQIEQIQGQMKYLEQMSAMATITVRLLPFEPTVEPPVVEEGFDPLRTVNRAARALVLILQGLLNVLIWIAIVLLPIAALFAIPVLVILWLVRRSRKRKSQIGNRQS